MLLNRCVGYLFIEREEELGVKKLTWTSETDAETQTDCKKGDSVK